jgi:hypothetical protein
MFEKRLAAVPPQLLTGNGPQLGQITVADASLYKVKQVIHIQSTTATPQAFEIKQIIDIHTMFLGPIGGNISAFSNVSAWLVADGAFIFANEQLRPKIPEQEVERATYEEEPTVARRVILVDPMGTKIDDSNPLPVAFDGTISIGDVSIVEGGNTLAVNPDGSINVEVGKPVGLFNLPYDSIKATYPSATQENYQSYVGGISGTPVQLTIVTYTDTTKNNISTVARTPVGP